MSKGRTPPPARIDHAAALRDRLGRAAIEADNPGIQWDRLAEVEREYWRGIGDAVRAAMTSGGGRRGDFAVASVYGYETQKPYVNLEVSISPMQLSPAKARECALMLLECADAAESDAALITFARTALNLDDRTAAALLAQFRAMREQARGKAVESA